MPARAVQHLKCVAAGIGSGSCRRIVSAASVRALGRNTFRGAVRRELVAEHCRAAPVLCGRRFCSSSSSSSGSPGGDNKDKGSSNEKSGQADRSDVQANAREQEQKGTEQVETWGDKLFIFGALLRVAAMLPRFAGGAQALRFAGTGPMLVGAVITVYEIGGWKLVVSIPVVIVAGFAVGNASDEQKAEDFKKNIMQELRTGCPELPEEVYPAIHAASSRQYETNKMILEVVWPQGTDSHPQWRCDALAKRSSFLGTWATTSLKVSHAVESAKDTSTPPPQTRSWDAHAPQMTWQLHWSLPQS
mmetsp:Transcript_56470/g.132452  ORF Transcript_56470/g.132452 Transcript_56470/m.132452 type:complete len:303 (-) Transcript_56470:34-942(-)